MPHKSTEESITPNFSIKKTFNSYYVPTGADKVSSPNFYSSLNQSRIGLEVTRKLETKNVFIRLETDFNGGDGDFRIRHAYGQINNFLVGQTWSLFSNVSSLPVTVDSNDPTGSVTLRTSQIRYSGSNKKGTRWAAALEYSRPDLNFQAIDTTGLSTVQLFPDVTARIEREGLGESTPMDSDGIKMVQLEAQVGYRTYSIIISKKNEIHII
jgi:hypothetical protein